MCPFFLNYLVCFNSYCLQVDFSLNEVTVRQQMHSKKRFNLENTLVTGNE